VAALRLAGRVLAGATPTWGPGEMMRVDALSALLAVCVAFVAALAAWLGPGLGRDAHYGPGQARRFRIFSSLFAFTMLAAVTANNVAVMWVAIEATTITSALIIPLTVSKASVEASWKYILICSVGIALAFVGTVLGYFDYIHLAGESESALNWTSLMAAAPAMHPRVVELAFVFILIGYGTKAGLAPMHTWLPDAHAEAPAPLSAMMSGVLLAVALYAIIRWKAVVGAAVGSTLPDRLLLVLGLASLAIASLSLVGQRHYKRLLAYSSIEHTGLMCLGLGLGPLGAFAALLHLVNHAVAKSMMFFLSGRILDRYRTTELGGVSGLLRAMPVTGGSVVHCLCNSTAVTPLSIEAKSSAFFDDSGAVAGLINGQRETRAVKRESPAPAASVVYPPILLPTRTRRSPSTQGCVVTHSVAARTSSTRLWSE